MRIGSIIVAIVGIGIAGGSVWLTDRLLNSAANNAPAAVQETLVAEPDIVKVWVAKTDLVFGQAITADAMETQDWLHNTVPAGAYTDIKDIVGDVGAQPRRATRQIAKGELILEEKVSEFGETVTITQKLGTNTRAVAIKVDAVTAVGGFVTPGDHVDIVLTQGRGETLRAATILQNVRVVGVDQSAEHGAERSAIARTITVEVSPRDGQKLALAQNAGTLSLTLRTLDAVEDEYLEPITMADLLGEAKEVYVPEVAPVRSITVRRAGQEEVVSLKPTPADGAIQTPDNP